ncbi:MAG: TlpA family protein disulfide reductase, partial [Flavobacteriales bacterium]|nr:TlpA family protein disulfide reductase [Flavobacteriales bacterium]
TWCGPCKAEMPAWEALQKEYGDRINFVSISVWDNEDKWKEMSKSLGHAHSMFIPKTDLGQLEPYMVNAIPRYMVLDKDLRIVTIDAPRPSSGELQKFF